MKTRRWLSRGEKENHDIQKNASVRPQRRPAYTAHTTRISRSKRVRRHGMLANVVSSSDSMDIISGHASVSRHKAAATFDSKQSNVASKQSSRSHSTFFALHLDTIRQVGKSRQGKSCLVQASPPAVEITATTCNLSAATYPPSVLQDRSSTGL